MSQSIKRLVSRRIIPAVGIAALLLALLVSSAFAQAASGYANGKLLVEPSWLQQHLNDPNLVVIDARGSDLYSRGHIPGAAVAEGAGALVDKEIPIPGYLVPADQFESLARSLGVNGDSTVVIYDNSSNIIGARYFYAFEYYGLFNHVRLLNGGFAAWTQNRGPITTEVPQVAEGNFRAVPEENRISTAEYVEANLDSGNMVVVDSRSPGEYNGTDVRAERGGHIPGAVLIDWNENVQSPPVQRFKPASELEAIYDAAGVGKDKTVVPYCQTNVRGSNTYFVLRLLGYSDVRPYEGSWAEWGNRNDLPIQK